MNDPLNPDVEEIRSMGREALERIAVYYGSLAERPVVVPSTSEALRGMLSEPLPGAGTDFGTLLQALEDVVFRYSRHNAHPRFFGYISSPGTAVAAVGAMIEAALNANVSCWRSAPPATEMEHVAVGWLKEMLGYPKESAGLLTSGGSMANFAGLAAARAVKGGGRVYVSDEGHFSIRKAAAMLGVSVSEVRCADELPRAVSEDRAAGHAPFCLVANAGTTATGAVDPIAQMADFARREGLWLHVDAAYGGFAALAPSARHWFAGIGEADSVALDPHKWLYLPVGCGCVLYRDAAAARAAFGHEADYTRPIGLEHDEAFAFWDYGPELSRPFRALGLWLLIKYAGTDRLAAAIEQNIACAKYLEKLVEASADFEMLAPVTLSVFCFRYCPPGFAGDLDALNERLLVALQRDGSSYLSNAQVAGKFALRGCVLNYRTTERDMEQVLEDVRRVYRGL